MKKLCLLALPLLAAALPSQAAAQDADAPTSGFRIDLIAGYDDIRADPDGDDDRSGFHGAVFGAGVGYEIPMGTVSFGIDAEATFTTTDLAIDEGELSAGRDLYVGGRLSGHVSDRVTVYGKLGYTNLAFRTDLDDGEDVPDLDVRGTLDGVRGALGITLRSGDDGNVYYGLEGRYSNYEAGVTRRQLALVIGTRF
ncbi:MAG TPA: outer membrane beta-barrel protein [Allosphingosinicella sp.]|jgi:outer membrane immunogenic protein